MRWRQDRKKISIIVSMVFILFFFVLIGPVDMFKHGFYSEKVDVEQIVDGDWTGAVNLEEEGYEMQFSPQKKYFKGFEIWLINQPEGNTGNLTLMIINESGEIVDNIDVDLSKVMAASWYKLYSDANLKVGEEYTLKFVPGNCDTVPYLQEVDEDYMPEETVSGNVLLAYAYAKPTFNIQEKVLFFIFVLAAESFLSSILMVEKKRKVVQGIALGCLMTGVLSWNYMYNSIDEQNTRFNGFQADSEALVTGMIYAEKDGTHLGHGYGMGRYYNIRGEFISYEQEYLSTGDWVNGYSKEDCAIIISSNAYTREVAVVGNYVKFDNQDVYQIIDSEDNGRSLKIYFDRVAKISSEKNGSLDDVLFLDSNGLPLPKSMLVNYTSQYGLNGKIFRHIARYLDDSHEIATLNLICCILAGIVFSIIVFIIFQKYNSLMAICFFIVFWLSPWVVNFARNLYWVEFTWFIPMLVGLFCAWKIENASCRIISYICTFFAIFIKCLCGYEYISTIMMGLISFLLVDLIKSIVEQEKRKSLLLLKTIVFIGVIALVGFVAAICIHASLRGDGNLIDGIKSIIEQDVLRRTSGADLNELKEDYWASLNASVWETCSKYFHFYTNIITGISGSLFSLLCVGPLCIMGYNFYKKRINIEVISMYVIFFFSSVSWFCLAKGHSYVHTHMNYVLWYFGYVQICIYIVVSSVISFIKNRGESKE